MSFSFHDACVPVVAPMLDHLGRWLQLADDNARSRGFDSANFLALRLAPDMLPFASQVKIAGDIAKMTVSRLADVPMTAAPGAEDSLVALQARVSEAAEFVRGVDPSRFEGAAGRDFVLDLKPIGPTHFTGATLLQRWALPNIFFHLTTSYNLLRHAGVPLGKADFLGLR